MGLLKPVCVQCNHGDGFERRVLTRAMLRTMRLTIVHTQRQSRTPAQRLYQVRIHKRYYTLFYNLRMDAGSWLRSQLTSSGTSRSDENMRRGVGL